MKGTLILGIALFIAGILVGMTLHASSGFATPIYNGGFELPATLYEGVTGRAIERPSPENHIKTDQIEVYQDKVVLDLKNTIFARFSDTNSMDPVLDAGANAIEIKPTSPDDVQEGDIIAYQNKCTGTSTIIHRVIKQGKDQLGTYYIVKGDNNPRADPCLVRFGDIKGVVVGILY